MKIRILTLIILLSLSQVISAQINDIKIKSQNNSRSNSSSNIDFDDASDVASELAECCISNVFYMLIDGCMTGIFNSISKKRKVNNDLEDDYYNEPMPKKYEYENIPDKTVYVDGFDEHIDNGDIDYAKRKSFFLGINALLDISGHKGIDKNYMHIDYLPGLRASWHFIVLDFRYNVLTQLSADDIDAFKSWELLFAIDFSLMQNYSIILGTGVHRELYQSGNSFNEFLASFEIPIRAQTNSINISSRFSIDYDTEVFPFFEINTRYNHKIFSSKNVSTCFTVGITYQNYYESYDILGLRTGIIIGL